MTSANFDCQDSQDRIEDLLADDLTPIETASLLDHLRLCESCTELFELHARLTEMASPSDEVDDEDLAMMRSEVIDSLVHQGRLQQTQSVLPWWRKEVVSARWQGALAAMLAVMLVGAGWWAARLTAPALRPESTILTQSPSDSTSSFSERTASLGSDQLQDYELRNVRVRDIDATTVALSFDVATHMELEKAKDDPIVTEALVQSILGASDLGDRLSSIAQAAQDDNLTPRVRKALIQAMLNDPNLAVKLQAQSKLADNMPDPAVEKAMLEVLEKEDSVRMRLVAIDILSSKGVGAELLRQAVEAGQPEPGNALKVRASDYLARQ